jgi:hypothetical protein
MTGNDTTYFISNPKQWTNLADEKRHWNTFHFLQERNKPKRNYSDEEIKNKLENKNGIKKLHL